MAKSERRNMSISIALLLLLAPGYMLWSADAFAPVASRTNGFTMPITRSYMSTVQDERMTEEDEDFLFGDENIEYPGHHPKKSKTGAILRDPKSPLNPLDHSLKDPLINKLRTMRETTVSCPGLWKDLAKNCPNKRAILDEHMCDEKVDLTFKEMEKTIRASAAAFASLGVKKGMNVAILGENSAKWLIADHGIQLLGGASSVRGADAPSEELRYIYEHSESAKVAVIQGPKLLKRLAKDAKTKGLSGLGLQNEKYGSVKTIVLLHREKMSNDKIQEIAAPLDIQVFVLSDLLETVKPISANDVPKIGLDDLSTIVYTSGTTGQPKGVMLTHGNLLHQLGHRLAPTKPYDETEPLPGEIMLSLLPVWHITERTFELWMFSRGCNVVYSSIRSFKNDLAKHKPQWMVLVPRVLEKVALGVQGKFASGSAVVKTLVKLFTATGTMKHENLKIASGVIVGDEKPSSFKRLIARLIVALLAPLNAVGDKLVWSKVKDGFGGRQKCIISGGSALAGSLESFYELCGIDIIVGYGLTECSPLIAHRRLDANLITGGCVGKAVLDTELRVVDPESKADSGERKSVPIGEVGVVIARGPQVMKGYFKNPEATAKAVDKFGWFDTGDLGRVNPATGDIILTGRCKDTIVLSNGENIEPSPIEDAILSESSLVEQVMLTGQDGRKLVAIVVLNPSELVGAGFLNKKEGKALQAESERVNDPKCSEEDCAKGCDILAEASVKLRSDKELGKALLVDMKSATKDFRKWEQVGDVYITLEPFAMANGQLTQSYKVKRDSVLERYGDSLED
uniref:AMP-dependent synthetase/ligase domain-containing protein n=1 Tax=Attheya septentrionalis TaxID=420275 RepID=A0A7S2UNN2_9STRA|mmetsp:Transcript_6109/g.10852  ORF Transcript_6109/g.10852 Transcript_6109/m.10852 type:complete len:797 (+) Transcript_6109:254-2644(+)